MSDLGRWNSEMEPKPMLIQQNSADTHQLGVVMEPFNANDQEERIRAALGITHGPLPEVQSRWLRRYYEYLSAHLSLPFDGEYAEDISGYRQLVAPVAVVALLHPGAARRARGVWPSVPSATRRSANRIAPGRRGTSGRCGEQPTHRRLLVLVLELAVRSRI